MRVFPRNLKHCLIAVTAVAVLVFVVQADLAGKCNRQATAVVCLVNKQRHHHGLPELSTNAKLDRSAQEWANYMARHHYFGHGAWVARITATGLDWSNIGENIVSGSTEPTGAVNTWMASTGHCKNILDPVYRNTGVGVAGRYWVQDFGLVVGQRPPSADYGPANGCPYASRG